MWSIPAGAATQRFLSGEAPRPRTAARSAASTGKGQRGAMGGAFGGERSVRAEQCQQRRRHGASLAIGAVVCHRNLGSVTTLRRNLASRISPPRRHAPGVLGRVKGPLAGSALRALDPSCALQAVSSAAMGRGMPPAGLRPRDGGSGSSHTTPSLLADPRDASKWSRITAKTET